MTKLSNLPKYRPKTDIGNFGNSDAPAVETQQSGHPNNSKNADIKTVTQRLQQNS